MLGMFAQFERDTIIDRVVNGMERKAAKGLWKADAAPSATCQAPLIDTDTYAGAACLVAGRGEDHTRRRANASGYTSPDGCAAPAAAPR